MKRRLVIVFLVAFAIWPALHRVLVAVYDVNPWKLAGWAMYTRPHFPSDLRLRLIEQGRERPLTELDEQEQMLAAEFVERRYSVGRLASPESLARAILAVHGDAEGIVVEVYTRYFDLESATIRRRSSRETYLR